MPTLGSGCSVLMNSGTHLGENARLIEVSGDQKRGLFSADFKHEAANLVLKQSYSFIEASRYSSLASQPCTVGSVSFSKSAQVSPPHN